jgi:hypothetical protein
LPHPAVPPTVDRLPSPQQLQQPAEPEAASADPILTTLRLISETAAASRFERSRDATIGAARAERAGMVHAGREVITSGRLTICANAARRVDLNAGMEGDSPSWPAPRPLPLCARKQKCLMAMSSPLLGNDLERVDVDVARSSFHINASVTSRHPRPGLGYERRFCFRPIPGVRAALAGQAGDA